MSGQTAIDAMTPKGGCAIGPHACEVLTTCQPPSSWCKDPWPATIRDISNSGLSLTLGRRFERGSGLAIELPAQDGSSSTILARVSGVSAHPTGWLLACSFVSELSDEEVRHVVDLDPLHQAALAGKPGAVVSGVLFHARIRPKEYLRWYVKRLNLSSAWPLPAGLFVSFQVGGMPEAPPVEMKVRRCQLFGSYWIIECKLLSVPSDEVLRALTTPPAG